MTGKSKRKDIYQEVTNLIVAELEKGCAPWLKPWKTSGAKGEFKAFGRPCNAVTGRKYSGVNVLLLWCTQYDKGYSDDRWLTFKQAKELGGHVRKGEKATQIVFMKPISKTVQNDDGEEDEQRFMMARSYSVFNVEQCEGLPESITKPSATPKPKPVLVHPEPVEPVKLCPEKLAWVKAAGVTVKHGGGRAFYASPPRDMIQMPKPEDFETQDHYWATHFHELVHWTMPKHRLDRNFGCKRWGDEGYAMEELVAELGAAYICADHGVEGEMRHAGYIESWLRVLKNDKRAIFTAASRASQAAEFLHAFSEAGEEEKAA